MRPLVATPCRPLLAPRTPFNAKNGPARGSWPWPPAPFRRHCRRRPPRRENWKDFPGPRYPLPLPPPTAFGARLGPGPAAACRGGQSRPALAPNFGAGAGRAVTIGWPRPAARSPTGPFWGANSVRVADFWGRELAPRIPWGPPTIRNFRNSRNFQISPNFRGFRDFGSCPPKRAAVSGIPGFGGSDVGGRDWREAGLDLGG